MSTEFIHADFLLQSKAARELYHRYAADLPIIDYHCHLKPSEIAEDKRWENITQIWLYGDHYKWRAMRTAGIAERFCTGDASDWEKFRKYAELMPKALRNPLYHWTHLELARYFGVSDRLLGPDTAQSIYEECNRVIAAPDFSCRSLMKKSRVEVVCTTDDPVDSLVHHSAIAADAAFDIQVRPTWRPDMAWAVDKPEAFAAWLAKLEALSQLGLLSQFVGMLTDSRSFLSYTRHEYFRRLLCNILGNDMERGLLPNDLALVGAMVADISYHNARNYVGFFPGALP